MQSVSSEQVDECITQLVRLALESLLQERCTQCEARLVRAALETPAMALEVDQAEQTIADALLMVVPEILNAALYGE
jgi:hypothetical protein